MSSSGDTAKEAGDGGGERAILLLILWGTCRAAANGTANQAVRSPQVEELQSGFRLIDRLFCHVGPPGAQPLCHAAKRREKREKWSSVRNICLLSDGVERILRRRLSTR